MKLDSFSYLCINLKLRNSDKHIEMDKSDIKSKKEEIIKTKPDIKSSKDIKMIRTRPDMNDEITYEEEKAALILGITSIFAGWWMFK